MARIRKSNSESISLFPFLSILACVIGCLTLIISALTVSNIGKDQGDDEIRRADEYDLIKTELAKVETQLNARSGVAAENKDLIAKIETEKKRQQQIQAELEENAKGLKELENQLADLQSSGVSITKKVKALSLKRDETKQKISALKGPPADPKVMVLPAERGGGGGQYQPSFVEVTNKGVVLRDRDNPLTIPLASLKTNPDYTKLLDEVGSSEDQQIVYLLRSNAYGVFNTVRVLSTQKEARYGVLPVMGDGKLDLSGFENL